MTVPPGAQAGGESNAVRGAKNVVARCLRVAPGERVHILTFRGDALYPLLARAVDEAAAFPIRVPIDALDDGRAGLAEHVAALTPLLAGASASILVAPVRPSAALSMAVAKAAEQQGARHVHLLQVDERMLGQSVRADPDLLAIVNERLTAAVRPPCVLRVTSEHGTDVEVRLALTHPILSSIGRPARGASENLPAGVVYMHPARVSGTYLVDRAVLGPGIAVDRAAIRRAPVRVTFAGGKVSDFTSADAAVTKCMKDYLASHADAGRVGLLLFSTNYLVRSDVGLDRQDMLLPGMGVSLGYAAQATTGAPYEVPVQMVLLGRKQTVDVAGRVLVDAGRLVDPLVDGIDPFR